MSTDWKWWGNAGHLCVGNDCRFHMLTEVGDHFVSTVGEYRPIGSQKAVSIGGGDLYETMVFKVVSHRLGEHCDCGMPQGSGENLDMDRYMKPGEATKGHMAMCEKWAAKK